MNMRIDKRKELNKQKYEGKIFTTNQGCKLKVLKYNNARDVLIEFQDEHKYKKHITLKILLSKNNKNPYCKNILNIACLGERYLKIKRRSIIYRTWFNMLLRCYDKKMLKRSRGIAYQNCIICEKWHNFTNFYNWIIKQKNYDKFLKGGLSLDKDILSNDKKNRIYSPENCLLVSNIINNIFVNKNNNKGVKKHIKLKTKPYEARLNVKGKYVYLGTFKTQEEAFKVYKEAKEKYIKEVANEEYKKGNITKRCYDALMKYQVNIND